MNVLIIGQEKIESVKPGAPVASADAKPVIESASVAKNIYDRNKVNELLGQAKTTEQQLFILSRTNPTFVRALNYINA